MKYIERKLKQKSNVYDLFQYKVPDLEELFESLKILGFKIYSFRPKPSLKRFCFIMYMTYRWQYMVLGSIKDGVNIKFNRCYKADGKKVVNEYVP